MKTLIHRTLNSPAGFDTMPLRVVAGLTFTAHGAQKLFGWFGGYGLEGTAGWMASIGLNPGMLMALLAGSAEFFGGIFLILGLLVRPSALVLAFTMVIAVLLVHLPHGFFMSNNGYEYALVLLAISVALLIRGAGSVSVDSVIQKKLNDLF